MFLPTHRNVSTTLFDMSDRERINLLESLDVTHYTSKENNITVLYQLGHGKYAESYIVNRTARFYHLLTNSNDNITILYQLGHGKYRNKHYRLKV